VVLENYKTRAIYYRTLKSVFLLPHKPNHAVDCYLVTIADNTTFHWWERSVAYSILSEEVIKLQQIFNRFQSKHINYNDSKTRLG